MVIAVGRGRGRDGREGEAFLIVVIGCFSELEILIREVLGCRLVVGMFLESGLIVMLYDGFCLVINLGGVRSYSL